LGGVFLQDNSRIEKSAENFKIREMGGLARLLATAALRVRIQTSLKYTKYATKAKERPTHSSLPKNILKNFRTCSSVVWIAFYFVISLGLLFFGNDQKLFMQFTREPFIFHYFYKAFAV
jgi:hypothetical protein